MGRVLTNATGLRMAYESATGTLPGSPTWHVIEFDNITSFGAVVTSRARRPVSTSRGRAPGGPVDLDSAVDIETDLTIGAFELFIEGFSFAEFANVEFDLKDSGGPPTPTGTGYTIDAASALLAGKIVFAGSGATTLVYAKGYNTAANNGLKVLTADVGSTDTEVTVSGLTAEASPPSKASLQVAGLRTDDVTVTVATNGTGTLVSAADVSDWSTYGLRAGMYLHVGGTTDALVLANAPTISATTVYGYVRIVSISGATLNFDKADPNLIAAGAGSSSGSQTLDFLFGRFARNVETTADSDDERYLDRTHQFEGSYPGLGSGGATEYEYSKGNSANEMALNMPLADAATVTFGFIGTDTEVFTTTRKTNAASAIPVLRRAQFGTSVELSSITTDLISSVSDVCFKSVTLTMLNNVSAEKCLGTLGARFVNAGVFEFNIEGQLAFTSSSITNAVRNNTTVTMAFVLRNEDGAIAIDVPSAKLSGGGREFPRDQTVLVNVTAESFTDPTYGHDVGTTIFPVVPLAAA